MAFLLFLVTILNTLLADDPFIWPLPTQFQLSDSASLAVSNSFLFVLPSDASDILQKAVNRYERITFPHTPEGQPPPADTQLTTLTITVADNDETMSYGMDESYDLTITAASSGDSTGTLTANTIWGALRGLETFSQIVIYDFDLGYYISYDGSIQDKPRFSHRGILIDTSRHFESVDGLKQLISSMSYAKFNVLHWHIVDTQSFPYESFTYPKLWEGSYTQYERYSQQDVIEVVEYAQDHGIRVIPEFDVPGHAQSWCVGYPGVCPSPNCTTPLNPAVQETWDVITGLIEESYNGLFIDNWIHLGGDEVSTTCWTETQSIVDWMNENNYTARSAYGYFVERAMDIAYYDFGLQVINWVEVFNSFNTSLNRNVTVIEVWKSKTDLKAAVEDGFKALLADSDLWYLDHLSITWQQMYTNEPYENIDDPNEQALILGGETCMWGETVDISDMLQTVWPRAAAVAERLWSLQTVDDTDAALPRIEYFRCLLNQRGVQAAPTNNKNARSAPPNPGSCYDQRRRFLDMKSQM